MRSSQGTGGSSGCRLFLPDIQSINNKKAAIKIKAPIRFSDSPEADGSVAAIHSNVSRIPDWIGRGFQPSSARALSERPAYVTPNVRNISLL